MLSSVTSTSISSALIRRYGEQSQNNVVAGLTDPTLVTPEKVNQAATRIEATLSDVAADQQHEQDRLRSVAAGLAAYNQQQRTVDAYLMAEGRERDRSATVSVTDFVATQQQKHQAQNELTQAWVSHKIQAYRDQQPALPQVSPYAANTVRLSVVV